MNALSPIVMLPEDPPSARGELRSGHMFRSRLIDKFARVEMWALGRLRSAGIAGKLPPTLGLRLGAVRKLTETHPHLFRKASTAAQLLDDLRPLQDLRSTVAHSMLRDGRAEDGAILCIFDRADSDGAMPWRDRIAVREDELSRIIGRVSDLAHKLEQQLPRSG